VADKQSDQFRERSLPYAAVGYFVSEVSRVELSMDSFALELHRLYPDIARKITTKFPRQIEDKRSFWIDALLSVQILRLVPFLPDGSLRLNGMYYSLIELFEARNNVAHGATDLTNSGADKVIYTATKAVQREGTKSWGPVSYRYSSFFIEELVQTAGVFRRYFQNLTECLKGSFSWESHYQEEKSQRENRRILREFGVNIPENSQRLNLILQMKPPAAS